MNIRTRNIGDRICIAHFSLSHNEANGISLRLPKDIDKKTKEFLFYKKIETEVLDKSLLSRGIIAVKPKIIRYLRPYGADMIIAAGKCLMLPEQINLGLPLMISIEDQIESEYGKAWETFSARMIENNKCMVVDCNVADGLSTVEYDLCYMKDGKALNIIENQRFSLSSDHDMDSSRFINAKVGDRIVIDEGDVIAEAVIKRIEKRIPYHPAMTVKGNPELRETFSSFEKAYKNIVRRRIYIDYIIDFVLEHTDLSIGADISDFYEERKIFLYGREFKEGDSETKKKAVRKSFIFDLIIKMIDLKGCLHSAVENFIPLRQELRDYYLNDDFDRNLVILESEKLELLRYCSEEHIIRGIHI